jgi:hypothetical protein
MDGNCPARDGVNGAPRWPFSVCLNLFHVHSANLPNPAKTKKPTVGFWASFFVIARPGARFWEATACGSTNHEKMRKFLQTRHFFWPDPRFSSKQRRFRGIFRGRKF